MLFQSEGHTSSGQEKRFAGKKKALPVEAQDSSPLKQLFVFSNDHAFNVRKRTVVAAAFSSNAH
jgi:hypothetical protein